MGGKMSRDKGKRGEREIVNALQPIVDEVYQLAGMEPPVVKRNTMQSDGGGFDLHGLDWMAIEVKYQESLNIDGWWKQTVEQTGPGQEAILVYRKSRVPWRVRMLSTIGPTSQGVRVVDVVDISFEAFLLYVKNRLRLELLSEY